MNTTHTSGSYWSGGYSNYYFGKSDTGESEEHPHVYV